MQDLNLYSWLALVLSSAIAGFLASILRRHATPPSGAFVAFGVFAAIPVLTLSVPQLIPALSGYRVTTPEGEFSITSVLKQDLGAATADINAELQTSKRRLEAIQREIDGLVPLISGATPPPPRSAEDALLERNSAYSVLIFYRSPQAEVAGAVERLLLAQGYRSSRTLTDLSESRSQFESGTAWLIYTTEGQEQVQSVSALLEEAAPGTRIVVRDSPATLRQGQIQILLF